MNLPAVSDVQGLTPVFMIVISTIYENAIEFNYSLVYKLTILQYHEHHHKQRCLENQKEKTWNYSNYAISGLWQNPATLPELQMKCFYETFSYHSHYFFPVKEKKGNYA